MNRTAILALVGFLCFWGSAAAMDVPRWENISYGIDESDIRTIGIHPYNPEIILIGTANALFRSTNRGRDFRMVLQPQGSRKAVNYLYIYPSKPDLIYAATDSGLYYSENQGLTFRQLFYSAEPQSRVCLSFSRDAKNLYVGTVGGLFVSEIEGAFWRPMDGGLRGSPVSFISKDKNLFYIAAGNDVYRLDPSARVPSKILSVPAQAGKENGEEDSEISPHPATDIRSIVVAEGFTRPAVYVSTTRGIFHSIDNGQSWEQMPAGSVPWKTHTSMVVFEHSNCPDVSVYSKPCRFPVVATDRGVFAYDGTRWVVMQDGMGTTHVNFLALDMLGRLYAATDQGLFFEMLEQALSMLSAKDRFEQKGSQRPMRGYQELQEHFFHEPSIRAVQKLAIGYAEVEPEKIANWRKAARHKALLPTVSFGLDRAATDLFHWDTGQSPDKLQRGRDYLDWDISLSWDLADFIWSTDQTTIDSRSKLMVELREDILDQVTRIYFERRRTQMELLTPSLDAYLKLEKEIRIAELTALIDALTGGEFSQKIEKSEVSED